MRSFDARVFVMLSHRRFCSVPKHLVNMNKDEILRITQL